MVFQYQMDIALLNPWWKGKELIEQDKHIRDFKAKKYQWMPPLLHRIRLSPGNIFTLRGPRQVGKTTMVKLLIKGLLENEDPRSVFFWNCDELVDFRELSSVLREFLAFAGQGDKYIFLDEISRVKDWQRSIKFLADAGELEHSSLLLTGSHTLDIKYGAERLPGRTGILGKNFTLLPLSFPEFISLVAPDLKLPKIKELRISEINKSVAAAKIFNLELKAWFEKYLVTGGFPLVINEFLMHNEIPDYLLEIYLRWVIGDIAKWGKQERILIQLLKSLLLKQSTALSWDSLAKDAEIKSHKTVSSYVEVLENMFVLKTLYFLAREKKMLNYAKNKKLYFLDPFIYRVFNSRIYYKEFEITPALIEAVVVSHLDRQGEVSYWKNKKEIDVVLRVGNSFLPCEVKYQNRIARQDFSPLHYFPQGVLITKDFLQAGEKYTAVPVHLFLGCLPC